MSDFRRRIMMGISAPNRIVPAADGKVWAYYDVIDTESPTQLLYSNLWAVGSPFEIDGVSVAKTQTYQFDTPGVHLVKMPITSEIYENIFRGTRLKEVYLPSTMRTLGATCFRDCSLLEYVGGLENITSIRNGAFWNCTALSMVVNCSNLQDLRATAFYNSGITGVESLGSITTMGSSSDESGMFTNAPLTFCNLPDTLRTMYQLCFKNCRNLTKLTLPSSLTTMAGYHSPIGQSYITELTCLATTPPTVSSTYFSTTAGLQAIYVPASAVNDYKAANKWSAYASIIQAIPE